METPSNQAAVLFAGGGTGGHIFPALAVWERLQESGAGRRGLQPIFAISRRAIDVQVLAKHAVQYVQLPAQPWSARPWHWPAFWQGWTQSLAQARAALQQAQVRAVVAMGGFVAGPVCTAAREMGVPVALVNLDAVPGRANRWMARRASAIFTVYPAPVLAQANKPLSTIGLPLRRAAVGTGEMAAARQALGLDPQRPTLFITAGSQGATSLNRMMVDMVGQNQVRRALHSGGWQVLHLTGAKDQEVVTQAYQQAQIPARVLPFCDTMGLAWAAASIALSRAGANSVAEVWANAVPTIFFPYPYHKDQHQKLNAQPLTQAGMAILMLDQIDPAANARQLAPRLLALMANAGQCQRMREQMRHTTPEDGAHVIADWVTQQVAAAPIGATAPGKG